MFETVRLIESRVMAKFYNFYGWTIYVYSPTIIQTAFIATTFETPVSAQISFGLSISEQAAAAESLISNDCSQDWIEVKTNFDTHKVPLVH